MVRSIQEIAFSNQAAWLDFFTERLPGSVLQRRSIADVFACTESAQSKSKGVPGFLSSVWWVEEGDVDDECTDLK